MPIYEFHCEKCSRDSEVLVRSTDWDGTSCPHCGSIRLSKKLSVFSSGTGGSDSGPSGLPPVCTGTPGACGMCSPSGTEPH